MTSQATLRYRAWFFATALLLPLQATAQTGSLPGTDIRSWATADIKSRLSYAGTWAPLDPSATGALIGPFWNVVKLDASQLEGVALGGWVFNGSFASTLPDTTPVRAFVAAQQPDGTLKDASARLLGNGTTNGAGSVIVADFNGDGLDDVVFPAHNESPFLWKSSTAWMSGPGGTLTKVVLPDAVMDHDARLVTLDGRKKILARSFGGSGNNGQGPGFNVIYSWTGSNFSVDTSLGDMGGQSVLSGPFTGNADNWLIIGDSFFGPGVPFAPTNPMLNYAYRFNSGVVSLPPITLPKPYFNDKPQYAGFQSNWDPYSKTHTSRLWTTDLNQDGLPDILAGQELWSPTAGLQKAVFQLLINRGGMDFSDQTDALAPEFSQDSTIDYSVRIVDVDGSGIDTLFFSAPQSSSSAQDVTKHGQYILVNDGTGRLYAAMHDEFRAMRTQLAAFATSQLPAGTIAAPDLTPQFIAYRTPSGALDFLATLRTFTPGKANSYSLVNVALQVNLATDFRRDLTVSTRNGSRRIRTFAGNDTIHRAVSDPDCAIDGGLGTNTVVYPGKRSDWVVARAGDKITVRPAAGPGGTDTLTRIQQARFDDLALDLATFADAPAQNFTALWWNPAESGWGVNFNHQGNTLFATLFTYDTDHAPLWLVMSAGALQADGITFTGDLYRTTGPAFNAVPFTPITGANLTKVGTMSVAFTGADAATLVYTVNGTTVTKAIQKQIFGSRAASCATTTGSRASLTNYQDLWWKSDESGWGINITHQDRTLFATLFTYDNAGRGLWLVMSAGNLQADGSYLGDLYRTTGPAFNAQPFTPLTSANLTKVGTMSLRFADGNTATLAYTVNGVGVSKPIARQVFASPVPSCTS